jgi:hypothetical protein
VDPANDAGPAVTTIPILSVDAPIQFRNSDTSGSIAVLGQQRPSIAIDLLIALFH